MLMDVTPVNSLSFHYVSMPLVTHSFTNGYLVVSSLLHYKQGGWEQFCTCFHEQDFQVFSQDWEQLGEEYTSPVLLDDEIFFQIGVLEFPPFHVLADI